MSAISDPRMLPCIHTFCFECLQRTGETGQKKPADKMPCPLCRKEFIIPEDGMNGLQKNFFIENLLGFRTTLQMGSATIICDMCNIRNEGKPGQIPKATMRCLECQSNYCDSCAKVHQFQKLSGSHQVVKIGIDSKSATKWVSSLKNCTKHTQKPLDYYCAECKKIVCVSCFVESHKLHDCRDVTTVDERFRQTIEKEAWKISHYADEMLTSRNNLEKRKVDFVKKIVQEETAILEINKELKSMIDEHTKSLLDELSVIKSNHLKQLEIDLEEIDRSCTLLKSFEAYCTELILKGSASDICSSIDELVVKAKDLERDHTAFISRPYQTVEVSLEATGLLLMANSNVVGKIKVETETTKQFENSLIVVGMSDGMTTSKNVIKINLHQHWPTEISKQEQIPTVMATEGFAAVCCKTMYVTGIGDNNDEIWKYNEVSGWMQCSSLVEGRRKHSAAFINEVLYICGGFVDSNENVLDSVEAYNAVTNKCTTKGKLAFGVHSSGNCVPFKSSLYIFGGMEKDDKQVNQVQVYSTKQNACSILHTPMPCSYSMMRAALWETSVILLGRWTCFIFNFETQTFQERKQFKTNVTHFGLVLEGEEVFVIGGGNNETVIDGKTIWTCVDDMHYVPLQDILNDKPIYWKFHGRLPQRSMIHAYEKLTLFAT